MGKTSPVLDTQALLDSAGLGKRVVYYHRGDVVFSQGDAGEHVLFLQHGGVKLSVMSVGNREAVVAVLGPGDFFGEGCLTSQRLRVSTATAMVGSTVHVLKKAAMVRLLRRKRVLSDRFISYMLTRTIRTEEDLIDQLFDSSEKRLAQALLQLARYGKQETPQRVLPKISQKVLAEMVGTTSSRVNFFLNKFTKLGFIKCNGHITIDSSLVSVVLQD